MTKIRIMHLLRMFSVVLILLILAMGFAPKATADSETTYSYVGNAYNTFYGTSACPPLCGITGSFTVAAPLIPDANYYFTPLSYSFTDGLTTYTSSDVTISDFGVVTNSLGQIVGWNMDWHTSVYEMFSGTNPPGCVGCSVLDGSFIPDVNGGEVLGKPGKWTESSSVPEPSSILMLSLGLLTLLGGKRGIYRKSSPVQGY
jgi:hypothetical protein